MNTLAQRSIFLKLIDQACHAGARLHSACHLIGLAARTLQRWMALALFAGVEADPGAVPLGDRRVSALRAHNFPPNKFSDAEREAAMGVFNSAQYKDLPPSQIVPRLADQGRLVDDDSLASESTLYRSLRQARQGTHRRIERSPQKRSKPRALVATKPDEKVCDWPAFPSAPALGSTHSAAGRPALFAGFIATTAGSDFSSPFIYHRLRLLAFPMRAVSLSKRQRSSWRSPGSRAKSTRTCQGLRPRQVIQALAMARPDVLPSAA